MGRRREDPRVGAVRYKLHRQALDAVKVTANLLQNSVKLPKIHELTLVFFYLRIPNSEKAMARKTQKVPQQTTDGRISAVASTAASLGGEGVDRIRDILFGAHIEEYEERFSQLEEKLEARYARLRKDLENRFESLESSIGKQLATITDKLDAESKRRSDSVAKLRQDQRTQGNNLKEELSELRKDLVKEINQITHRLEQETADLRTRLDDASAKITRQSQQHHDELQSAKVDRIELASLLTGLAENLGLEPKATKRKRK